MNANGELKKIRTQAIAVWEGLRVKTVRAERRLDLLCLIRPRAAVRAGSSGTKRGTRCCKDSPRAQCTLIHVAQPIQPSLHWSTFDHSMYHFCQAHR